MHHTPSYLNTTLLMKRPSTTHGQLRHLRGRTDPTPPGCSGDLCPTFPKHGVYLSPLPVPPGNPIIESREGQVIEGNETEMTCTAMGSKPAATIRWMKGDKELQGRLLPVNTVTPKTLCQPCHSQNTLVVFYNSAESPTERPKS